ncbi:hypothetical protein ACFP1Z_24870 [Streptomyces gamaensis]|uniref:DUF8017 domain-containing protein n=1 Tax=Streptomyces gamaensis TaxID=1763542 RepID=A0ABW0Z9Y4_9ACTN
MQPPTGPGVPPPPQGAPQWPSPTPPVDLGKPPRGGGSKRTTVIAIGAAVAVVAAAVVTGVVVLKDRDQKNDSNPAPQAAGSSPAAPSSPAASAGPDAPLDNPRTGGDVKPVIDGWKAVINPKRHDAFDVPADWTVESPTLMIGFEDDKGKGLVGMTGPSRFKKGYCQKNGELAAAGTKGAQGAKSEADAAEVEALNWVFAGFDQKKTGKFDTTKSQPFKSDYGITGYSASATVTGVKKTDKCTTDGKAFAVTYKDTQGDLATWVLYAAKGVNDELPDETIKKIMSSLRPLPSS